MTHIVNTQVPYRRALAAPTYPPTIAPSYNVATLTPPLPLQRADHLLSRYIVERHTRRIGQASESYSVLSVVQYMHVRYMSMYYIATHCVRWA